MRLRGTLTRAFVVVIVGLLVLGTVAAGGLSIVDTRADAGHPQGDDAAAQAAAEPTPIASCTTITEPGEYVLTQDIAANGSTNACIQIDVNGAVFIDGQGHSVEGGIGAELDSIREFELRNATVDSISLPSDTVPVSALLENVTVETIEELGYVDGLTVESSHIENTITGWYVFNATLRNSTFEGGLRFNENTAVFDIVNNTFNEQVFFYEYLSQSYIADNTFQAGLSIYNGGGGSENVTIENNNVTRDASDADGIEEGAIVFMEGRNVTIRDNSVTIERSAGSTATEANGIFITGRQNLVQGNTISGADHGIYLYGSSNGRIVDNVITDNDIGILIERSSDRVTNNTITHNRVGVEVNAKDVVPRVVFERNVLANNTEFGVQVTFEDSTFAPDDVVFDARNNYWGSADGPSSAPANDSDAPFADPVTGAPANGSGDAVSEGETAGVSNVRFDPIADSDDPSTQGPDRAITECTVITEPGEYVLANDIGPASGEDPCLLLKANNVTLDGNGFAIDGVVAVGEDDRGLFFRGHTLRDVTAHALRGDLLYDVTVVSSDLADGVEAVFFRNLTVTDSRLGGPVVASDDTGDVVVTNSTFDGERGVILYESVNGSLIANNTFETSDTAIFIGADNFATQNVRITNNRFDMNGGTAISTAENGRDIVVRDNVITNASIALDFLATGVISNNTLSGNDVGISVPYMEGGEDGLLIADNRITDNRVGVFVDADSAIPQIIRLRGNLIAGNSEFGVQNYFSANAYDEDEETPLLDARGNDWGDLSGPSSAPTDDSDAPFADPVTGRLADGAGDAVSEGNTPGVSNVRFDPFLTAPSNDTEDEERYYQVDFVAGDVIHTFGSADSDQFYSDQERLIRFLHGSTGTPVERVGTPPTLSASISSCIEVESFEVSGDIATVRYTVASGCSLDVALVSYEKPGPDWSRATASDQRLIDTEKAQATEPGTYELTVSLPMNTTATETNEALSASQSP